MTQILGFKSFNALLQKRLGPQTKLHSEFKASPLLYKTHPTLHKQISLPLIKN
jgi:hypothetical protein